MNIPKLRPFAQIRKAVINVVGLAAVVIDAVTPILHGAVRADVAIGLAIATSIAHYRVPNEQPTPATPKG